MPINGGKFNWTSFRLNSFQHPSSVHSAETAGDITFSWRYKMGEKNEQKLSWLVETTTAASHLSNRFVQDQPNEPCCSLSSSPRSLKGSVSRLQQSVFGDEPLHALPFQELHGSPVDLAAVLWLSERSQLLLDVLQPQIFGENKTDCLFHSSSVQASWCVNTWGQEF